MPDVELNDNYSAHQLQEAIVSQKQFSTYSEQPFCLFHNLSVTSHNMGRIFLN